MPCHKMISKSTPGNKDSISRGGFTVPELLIGSTLMFVLMALIAPLTLKARLILRDAQTEQIAIQELTNLLDELAIVDQANLEQAVNSITISDDVRSRLPGTEIEGEVIEDELGQRVRFILTWKEEVLRRPITLIGWTGGQTSDDSLALLESE